MVIGTIFLYCQVLPIYCQIGLIESKKMGKFYPYKLAKLIHYDFDPVKRWYVEFSAWDVKEGKLKRRRLSEFNNLPDLEQRKIFAENLVLSINELLEKGSFFDEEFSERQKLADALMQNKSAYSLRDALTLALELKQPTVSKRTHYCYSSDMNKFFEYAKVVGCLFDNVLMFEDSMAVGFGDYLSRVDGLRNKSINLRVGSMKSLFQVLVERKIVRENPFKAVKNRKVVLTSKNVAYTDKEIKKIKRYLLANNPNLWDFCQFVFYTFMRPEEIKRLKVKSINLSKRQIYINAEDSKVKKEGFVEITDGLMAVIKGMDIDWKDQERYVFYSPSNGPYKKASTNHFANMYRVVMDELGFDENHTIYSWKHTGNVKAYLAGIGLYAIMAQNRHSTLETTKNYLKSLGLLQNREFSDKFNKVKI